MAYTTFEYCDLTVTKEGIEFVLTNTGKRDGAEVAQMYVGGPKGSIFRPDKELKGFAKVFLKAGESRQISIPFDDKTFRYWNTKTNAWEIKNGDYLIYVGANASDIRLEQVFACEGTTAEMPYDPTKMQKYFSGLIREVADAEFEELIGYPLSSGKWSGELGLNDAVCQLYYAKSGVRI